MYHTHGLVVSRGSRGWGRACGFQPSMSLAWPRRERGGPDMSCGRPKKKKSICEGVNWQLRNVNKCTAILSGGIYFGPQRQVLQSPGSPHSCNRNPVTKHGNKKSAGAADPLLDTRPPKRYGHFEPCSSKLFTQKLRARSLPASSHLSYSVTRTAIFS